jgi:exopolyphosphatase/guanosine-5'-triphosphate,3'-diphosphate pyrophosphatase
VTTFGAVDIGANSVRLKIARLRGRKLTVLAEDREVVRLGEAVFRTGLLDPQAMEKTVKVLRRFHRTAQKLGATRVRVVATSSLRDAKNSSAFIDWVKSATGWTVEVISGLEEGRLIHLGVISNTRVKGRLLLIDLGGGSCELTVSLDRQIKDIVSLPVGAVRLTKEFLRHDPPKKRELEQMRAFIAEELSRVVPRINRAKVQLSIATSGTAAALMESSAAQRGDSSTSVPRVALLKLAAKLAKTPLQQRLGMPGIGPRRAEIIIAGATLFGELMTELNLASFRYLPLGLRDGLLAQMVADYDRHTRVRKQLDFERENSLTEVGQRYGIDRRYAQRIRKIATQLFNRLKPVHRLPQEYLEWISAAAMLHEIGSYINRAGRHRHAYYLIANSEIFGYTTQQRAIVAAIARYAGQSRPRPQDRIIRILPDLDRHFSIRAIALLRLALALDKSRSGVVQELRVGTTPAAVRLSLAAKRGTGDLELWAVDKERDYFRAVFGKDLVAVLA